MHWVMNKVLGPVRFPCNYSINDSFREENPVKAVGCTQGPIRLYDLRETPPDEPRTKPAPTPPSTPHHPIHSFLLSFGPAQSFSGWLFGAGGSPGAAAFSFSVPLSVTQGYLLTGLALLAEEFCLH